MCLGLLLGCAQGDPPGSTSFGPGPWMLPGESGDQEEGGSGAATESTTGSADGSGGGSMGPMTTADPSTSGMPMGSTDDGDPTNDSQGGTFGMDDGGTGMQPASGWWAHCIPNSIACDAGLVCLSTDAGNDGVCTNVCNPPGNPGSCGASPGGTNMPICLSVGGDSVCALGCEGGLTCPGGMICINESDDLGPISICI